MADFLLELQKMLDTGFLLVGGILLVALLFLMMVAFDLWTVAFYITVGGDCVKPRFSIGFFDKDTPFSVIWKAFKLCFCGGFSMAFLTLLCIGELRLLQSVYTAKGDFLLASLLVFILSLAALVMILGLGQVAINGLMSAYAEFIVDYVKSLSDDEDEDEVAANGELMDAGKASIEEKSGNAAGQGDIAISLTKASEDHSDTGTIEDWLPKTEDDGATEVYPPGTKGVGFKVVP